MLTAQILKVAPIAVRASFRQRKGRLFARIALLEALLSLGPQVVLVAPIRSAQKTPYTYASAALSDHSQLHRKQVVSCVLRGNLASVRLPHVLLARLGGYLQLAVLRIV